EPLEKRLRIRRASDVPVSIVEAVVVTDARQCVLQVDHIRAAHSGHLLRQSRVQVTNHALLTMPPLRVEDAVRGIVRQLEVVHQDRGRRTGPNGVDKAQYSAKDAVDKAVDVRTGQLRELQHQIGSEGVQPKGKRNDVRLESIKLAALVEDNLLDAVE